MEKPKKDDKYNELMGKLSAEIPTELKERIIDVASLEKIGPIYRVDKKGDLSEEFLLSTNEEFPGKYDPNDLGTYSTSVYDDPGPCVDFINSLKGKIRMKYPHPVVRSGFTSHGLAIHTFEYKDGFKNKNHIDWWIFCGEKHRAAKKFEVYK